MPGHQLLGLGLVLAMFFFNGSVLCKGLETRVRECYAEYSLQDIQNPKHHTYK